MFYSKRIKRLESRLNELEKTSESVKVDLLGESRVFYGTGFECLQRRPNLRHLVEIILKHFDLEYTPRRATPDKLTKIRKVVIKK